MKNKSYLFVFLLFFSINILESKTKNLNDSISNDYLNKRINLKKYFQFSNDYLVSDSNGTLGFNDKITYEVIKNAYGEDLELSRILTLSILLKYHLFNLTKYKTSQNLLEACTNAPEVFIIYDFIHLFKNVDNFEFVYSEEVYFYIKKRNKLKNHYLLKSIYQDIEKQMNLIKNQQ